MKNFYSIFSFTGKHKRKFRIFFVLFVLVLIPVEFFIFSLEKSGEDEMYRKSFLAHNKIYSPLLPENLDFAKEKVPLYDFTVIESLEKEFLINTYFHSQTILLCKRAYRWFPVIEAILKKNNVPDDFKYIPLVESKLSNVVSPKGAAGFWQFIESAGKNYGLEITSEVDERYHVEKSTEAACRYLQDAYKIFGSWTLAAASYNMGIDGVKKQLERQKAKSYYDLHLNEETARYVFRILAAKEIISHPEKYGFILRKKDLYPSIPVYEVLVDSSIPDLAVFAEQHEVSYKILKYFNPWLRKNVLTNPSKKTFRISLPKKGYNEAYLARLMASSASSDSLFYDTLSLPVQLFSPTADSSRKQ